jgi:23S rRNA (cytosine1962-C5)-methyltransferase
MPSPSTYALIDFGNAQRLEQWGQFRLIRPDPTAQTSPADPTLWTSPDATYQGEKGKGAWVTPTPLPAQWPVDFDDLRFNIRLTPYKHTGVFPEQQQNWQWSRTQSKLVGRPLKILNLFAYTGGATIALAKDGHFVTHVDSSKPTIAWAKENAVLNHIPADKVRWMLEDAPAFVAREIRRGRNYDAIILDPPAFGHSPSGKTWRNERDLAPLLENCCGLLSGNPSFLLLNGYAQQDTPQSFHRLLTAILHAKSQSKKFTIGAQELCLATPEGRKLSTGIVARCAFGRA